MPTLPPWPEGTVTFLFTDIKDSSVRARDYGDLVYDEELRAPHYDRLRELIHSREFEGRFFQDKGDGVVAVFPSASRAALCALAIQRSLKEKPIAVDNGPPLAVRMGLNTARRDQNLFREGRNRPRYGANALNFCARVEAPADAGQILLSQTTHDALSPEFLRHAGDGVSFHAWPHRDLKGFPGGNTLYDLLYDGRAPREPGRPWIPEWYLGVLDTFVARPNELREILEWDERGDTTFFVIQGMGGIGKTRLALEAGMALHGKHKDGVFFVRLDNSNLTPASTPQDLSLEIARQACLDRIDPTVVNDPVKRLPDFLAARESFLVLDNWESIDNPECAAWLEKSLVSGKTRCLITSRTLWPGTRNVTNQHLDALALPETPADAETSSAGQLFFARARNRDGRFKVHARDTNALFDLLHLTCGVPLAVELLAARAHRYVDDLAILRDEVRKKREVVLRTRKGDARVDADRHHSIEACIDWSLERLSAEQRDAFYRLAVFPIDFTRATAVEVCELDSEWLSDWKDASLLELSGRRFFLHPLVKDIAELRLVGETREHYEKSLTARALRWVKENTDPNIEGNVEILDQEWLTIDAIHEVAITNQDIRTATNLLFTGSFVATRTQLAESWRKQIERTLVCEFQISEADRRAWKTDLEISRGIAWSYLPKGNVGVNLENAIACFEFALEMYTRDELSMKWAEIQNNLGLCWNNLPKGDRGSNIEKAIVYFESALELYKRDVAPLEWAVTQNNLGKAWSNLPTGDREANLKNAIACFELALEVRTRKRFRVQWAMTQSNLGNAWSKLSSGNRGENLAKAVACYEASLELYTRREFPEQWAMTQSNLGNAEFSLGRQKEALARLRQARQVFLDIEHIHHMETIDCMIMLRESRWASNW